LLDVPINGSQFCVLKVRLHCATFVFYIYTTYLNGASQADDMSTSRVQRMARYF